MSLLLWCLFGFTWRTSKKNPFCIIRVDKIDEPPNYKTIVSRTEPPNYIESIVNEEINPQFNKNWAKSLHEKLVPPEIDEIITRYTYAYQINVNRKNAIFFRFENQISRGVRMQFWPPFEGHSSTWSISSPPTQCPRSWRLCSCSCCWPRRTSGYLCTCWSCARHFGSKITNTFRFSASGSLMDGCMNANEALFIQDVWLCVHIS